MDVIKAADMGIIIAYIIIVTGYGLFKARKVKNSEDFLVAGRSLGLFVLIGTIVMTEFNPATVIGISIFSYKAGIFACLYSFAFIFAFIPYTFIIAKKWKKLNAVTISEMFERRYDKNFRVLASLAMIIVLALFCSAYLKAAGLVFSTVMGLSFETTVIIIWTT